MSKKVKVKDMTKRDAIPVLEKILDKGDFGKRKKRALVIAINELQRQVSYSTTKVVHAVNE